MRGKVMEWAAIISAARITPAYAGKSPRPPVQSASAWDHPRLCGEKYTSTKSSKEMEGSPPPMRGKAAHRTALPAAVRITPAYAGKSRALSGTSFHMEDHPRLCGEKSFGISCSQAHLGSPPPMRGKGQGVLNFISPFRITPAYAGKRVSADRAQSQPQDHPRLCGEKNSKAEIGEYCGGSPPPMRGKVYSSIHEYENRRITPAYAGKSRQIPTHRSHCQDHPRLCGEKSTKPQPPMAM